MKIILEKDKEKHEIFNNCHAIVVQVDETQYFFTITDDEEFVVSIREDNAFETFSIGSLDYWEDLLDKIFKEYSIIKTFEKTYSFEVVIEENKNV